MESWILIIILSSGLSAPSVGPTVIKGFTSKAACEQAIPQITRRQHFAGTLTCIHVK